MRIFSKIFILSVLTVLLFGGCKKNQINYSDFDLVGDNQALLKVNYNIAFRANPGVQVKFNGQRITPTIQTRYPFPGGGLNTLGGSGADYMPITSGSGEISISIPKKNTNIDSVQIYKTTINTTAGKYYTLHLADTAVVKNLLVDEDRTLPENGFVKFRFVNLMANVPSVDLYIGSVKVASDVAFMSITAPFTLPITQTGISTTWAIRPAGAAATSTALATYNSASTLLNQRIYTAFATGYNGMTSTDIRRPYISFYYVR